MRLASEVVRAVLLLAALSAAVPSCARNLPNPAPDPAPGAAPAPDATPDAIARTVRILFIGNSYTYTNDLPRLFADFVEATYPGLHVVTESVAPSGESLEGNWESGTALQKIRAGGWDFVVLQDHASAATGTFRLDGTIRRERPDSFFDYGQRFIDAAVAARAQPVRYQTYEVKPKSDDLVYLDYAYMTLGKKTGALVAPVARVWHRLHEGHGFDLYGPDGVHPSIYGSYLAAVSIATTAFGDPPPAPAGIAVQHPAAIPEGSAREILDTLAAVRAELAPTGGYASVSTPDFASRPSLRSSLPLTAGTWSARGDGLELSLGSRITLSFDARMPAGTPAEAPAGTPRIELVDYTLNGAFSFPVSDVAVTDGVVRFTTACQNRTYHLQLARREEGVEVLVEQLRGKSSRFSHVTYRRGEGEDLFSFIDQQLAEISRQGTQASFESSLLRYYEALAVRISPEKLSQVLLGGTPVGDPWWPIMTGWEHGRRHHDDEAIRFLTFATHRFPQSCEAFQNLSEGLEQAGRFEEAYDATLQAEALAPKDNPELAARIQEDKARLAKLKPAPRAGGAPVVQ